MLIRRSMLSAAFAALLACSAAGALAQSYSEIGDAGQLLGTAQDATGFASITGTVGSLGDADLYRLTLTGGGTFSATVTAASFDTQLFLFDSFGFGVYANDDTSGLGLRSFLPAGHALTPTHAGTYYLAISRFDNDPTNFVPGTPPTCILGFCFGGTPDSGGLIFPNTFNAVVGPTGPGGGSPFTHWTSTSTALANLGYTIALTGVEVSPIPEPEVYAMMLAGFGLLGFVARRRSRFQRTA